MMLRQLKAMNTVITMERATTVSMAMKAMETRAMELKDMELKVMALKVTAKKMLLNPRRTIGAKQSPLKLRLRR